MNLMKTRATKMRLFCQKPIFLGMFLLSLMPLSYASTILPKPQPITHAHSYAFKSGSLAQFIQYIWQANPAVQSAQAEVASARASFSQSKKPLYNPNLDFDAQHVRNESLEDTYTAGISQTIDLFNKRGARAAVGQSQLTLEQAKFANTKLIVAIQALKALSEYRTAESILQLAKRRTHLLKQFKEQNVRKLQSGDIAQDALDQATLAYAEAISQQADVEVALIRAKERLTRITQKSANDWPKLPASLPSPLRLSDSEKKQRLESLPIIQALNAKVATANAGIRVAKTETKPDPTLSIRGGVEDNETLVGAGISIPLFVRNNYQDQVRAISHQAIAVEQARLNEYRKSHAALNSSLLRYQTLYTATANWQRESKQSLNAGVDLLNRLWAAGELSTTDYIVQLKQRIDSQIAGAHLKGQAWDNWLELMENADYLNQWFANSR